MQIVLCVQLYISSAFALSRIRGRTRPLENSRNKMVKMWKWRCLSNWMYVYCNIISVYANVSNRTQSRCVFILDVHTFFATIIHLTRAWKKYKTKKKPKFWNYVPVQQQRYSNKSNNNNNKKNNNNNCLWKGLILKINFWWRSAIIYKNIYSYRECDWRRLLLFSSPLCVSGG